MDDSSKEAAGTQADNGVIGADDSHVDAATPDTDSTSNVEASNDSTTPVDDAEVGEADGQLSDADASGDTNKTQEVVIQPVASDQVCHCWPNGGNCALLNLPPEETNPDMICPDGEICTGNIGSGPPGGVIGRCVRPCTPGGVEANPDLPVVLVCPDGYFCKGPNSVLGAEWEKVAEYYACVPTSAFTGQDDDDTSQ